MRRLEEAGHNLHIVTARLVPDAEQAAADSTRRWLATHHIPHTSLTITSDKAAVPTDIFLDDSTDIYNGLVEEKASRVVEVLLAAMRPVQLLAGKVIGIGLVALGQATLVVAVALVLAKAVGSDLIKGTAPVEVLGVLVWLVLGYSFYSWVYAAGGSLAERQEHLQSLAFPLQLPILFGYLVSLTSLGASQPSTFVKVLAYLPPTAPFAMPVLVADGAVAWWQFLASVAVTLVATVGIAQLAAAVYRRAILRTGSRVRLRELVADRA